MKGYYLLGHDRRFLLSLYFHHEDNMLSETSVDFQWTAWSYAPEDSTILDSIWLQDLVLMRFKFYDFLK
jgi:hypothetical protein